MTGLHTHIYMYIYIYTYYEKNPYAPMSGLINIGYYLELAVFDLKLRHQGRTLV